MAPTWFVNTLAPWRKRVLAVLARRSTAPNDLDAIERAVEGAKYDRQLKAMLDRERPDELAMIAPFDSVLRVEGRHLCFETEDGELSSWRYVFDPATLCVEPGTRVRAGDRLTEGEVDDQLWIDVFGDAGVPRLREKLVALDAHRRPQLRLSARTPGAAQLPRAASNGRIGLGFSRTFARHRKLRRESPSALGGRRVANRASARARALVVRAVQVRCPRGSLARALSERCEALVGGERGELAAMVDLLDVEGVLCATPHTAQSYRVYVERDANGRVEALAVRLIEDDR